MQSILNKTLLIGIFLVAGLSVAFATSYAPVQVRSILSANKEFELTITPKTGLHEIKTRQGQLKWTFTRKVWQDDYFISNDGNKVIWVAWPYVKASNCNEPAVIIYSEHSSPTEWTYDAVSIPRIYKENEIGPIGEFWRIWRGSASNQDGTIIIKTEGKEPMAISLDKKP